MLEQLLYEMYDADARQVKMVAWTKTQGNKEGKKKQKQLAEIIYRLKNN